MKKTLLLKTISTLVSFIGFILLIKSPRLGHDSANEYLSVDMFGQMDTDSFRIMEQSYIDAYRMAGAILLTIGIYYAFKFFSSKDE